MNLMMVMSKPMRYLFLGCLFPFLCFGQEEKSVTQPQDKMTLEKARVAVAESKWQKILEFGPLFNLPSDPESEIVDTTLTYQKARAALAAENKDVKKLKALILEKQHLLAKMIGKSFVEEEGKLRVVPNPPYTRKQYEEAKAAYENARDQLQKMKASSDERVLFKKVPKE